MVDNPKAFITIAVAFLLSVSVILYATNSYVGEIDKQNEFNLTVTPSTPKTTISSQKTSSTKTAPAAITPKQNPPTTNAVVPLAKADYTVKYQSAGFNPQTITVRRGQSVRFLNESSGTMFVAAARSPNSNDLTEFNQGRSVGKGGYYDFTFNIKGVFVYYNQNDRTKTGVIVVE